MELSTRLLLTVELITLEFTTVSARENEVKWDTLNVMMPFAELRIVQICVGQFWIFPLSEMSMRVTGLTMERV